MRRMLVLATMAMLGLAAGCRTINRGVTESVLERATEDQWQVQYGSRVTYTLRTETLTSVEFEGSVLSGDVVARYQRGLKPQAQCLAQRMSDLISRVSERTGVAISTRPTMYLLRFDQRPQNFAIMLAVEPNEFPLPLFVQVGDESCEAIIAQNHSYPYLVVHELVESSLVSRAGGRVLPDISWRGMGLNVHINNCTRWFRDGLANYAGYVAYEIVSTQVPSEQRLQYRQTLVHASPFTALAEIGDKLFTWPQSPAAEQERTYYNAALGLFLLIADTYGEQSIPYIVREIAERKTVDGKDLVEIAGRVLGTDVRRLAAEFKTPVLGIELDRLSPALALNRGVDLREGVFVQSVKDGGVAGKAGLKEKDVISAVGSTPVANLLDFELGLFRARRQSSTSLTVHRQNAGSLTVTLPLDVSDVEEKPSIGGRPKHEDVEVSCMVSPCRS
ncbi:MAG TPA: PDZ domain-containing protein [Sedimentisphaerales bacterium]|nr:PDZ domain-containing protein [Sedimentisphaerales bacterium]